MALHDLARKRPPHIEDTPQGLDGVHEDGEEEQDGDGLHSQRRAAVPIGLDVAPFLRVFP
jgi:hypothetical protein